MKITLILISLTVLQSYSLIVCSQELEFYREDIVFKIDQNKAVTEAEYHFCNVGTKDIRTSLLYPLPRNTMVLIDSLVVQDMISKEIIPHREGKSGVFFEIFVKAYGQSAYRVYFQQWLMENHFKYILTSTGSWGRSLELANYELQIPLTLSIDSLNYPPDSSFIQNNIRHFIWKKKDFMPDRDFEVVLH